MAKHWTPPEDSHRSSHQNIRTEEAQVDATFQHLPTITIKRLSPTSATCNHHNQHTNQNQPNHQNTTNHTTQKKKRCLSKHPNPPAEQNRNGASGGIWTRDHYLTKVTPHRARLPRHTHFAEQRTATQNKELTVTKHPQKPLPQNTP